MAPESPVVATVTSLGDGSRGQTWRLSPGDSLSIGRSPTSDLLLESPGISRNAGAIYAGPSFVAITRNSSPGGDAIGKLWVNSFDADGPVLVRPGGTMAIDTPQAQIQATITDPTSERWSAYELRADQLFGTPVIRIALTRGRQPATATDARFEQELPSTTPVLRALRAHPDHRLLVILCAPLFDYVGHNGDLPGNEEIARVTQRLGQPLAPGTVRNRLHEWKHTLGISGGPAAGVSHYQLALLARASGLVISADVDRLQRDLHGPLPTSHRRPRGG